MGETLAEKVLRLLEGVETLYYRLIIVAGPHGSGKTTALRAVNEATAAPFINVGIELSARLLELTQRDRTHQVPRILEAIVADAGGELVLLDNLEVLFDPRLRVDPLRLLLRLARHRTVVAAWNGRVEAGKLTYAVPDHTEHRSFTVADFLVVEADAVTAFETPEGT